MPDKHEVGGSSPLGPTRNFSEEKFHLFTLHSSLFTLHYECKGSGRQMLIENRIKKKKRTDSCITINGEIHWSREKLVIETINGFSVQ